MNGGSSTIWVQPYVRPSEGAAATMSEEVGSRGRCWDAGIRQKPATLSRRRGRVICCRNPPEQMQGVCFRLTRRFVLGFKAFISE